METSTQQQPHADMGQYKSVYACGQRRHTLLNVRKLNKKNNK